MENTCVSAFFYIPLHTKYTNVNQWLGISQTKFQWKIKKE